MSFIDPLPAVVFFNIKLLLSVANRMKAVLPPMIDSPRSAFVPRTNIRDNILLALMRIEEVS